MSDDLIIRPARLEDRGAAERICANTWDWGDYIPEVWAEWLADEQGHMAVAELEGQIVALGRVRLLPGGQAWLEGMRVDPDYRRQGVAWHFFHYKLAYARAHGARVVRLGTSDQNQPVHRMMERAGMARVGRYEMLLGPAAEPGSSSLVRLTPEHADQVHTFLRQSPVLAAARGLYCLDWAWQDLSEARAVDLLAEDKVIGQWGDAGNLAALAVVEREPDEERLWVGFADAGAQAGPGGGLRGGADPGALRAWAQALRGQAHLWGLDFAAAMLPDLPSLREAFRATGYGPGEWQGEIWIYEMPLKPPGAAGGVDGELPQDFGPAARGAETTGPQAGPGAQADTREGPGGVRT
jgi:GNAT superfamily N-acetyltransferase